jgi:hypothetical protein
MRFNLNQFMNSRGEWHYWWVGFAAGWTGGLTLGVLLAAVAL